jgi:hypothetical protein
MRLPRTSRSSIPAAIASLLVAIPGAPQPARTAPAAGDDRLVIEISDESGSAIAGARVGVWERSSGEVQRSGTRVSGPEGLVSVSKGSTAGTLVLAVSAPGFVPRVVGLPTLADARRRIVMSRGHDVELSVRDAADSSPIDRVAVLTIPAWVTEGDLTELPLLVDSLEAREFDSGAGPILLSGIPAEGATIVATSEGFAPATAVVDSSLRQLTVFLDSSGCFEIRVEEAETGSPVEGARVAAGAELLEGPLSRIAPVSISKPDGTARACFGSAFRLLIEHRDFAPAWIDRETVERADQREPPVVALSTGGAVRGMLLDVNGVAVAGAAVTARTAGLTRRTATDAGGGFLIERLMPGPFTLDAVLPAPPSAPFSSSRIRRTATAIDGRTIGLTLAPSAPLRVLVSLAEDPLRGSTVMLLDRIGGDGGEILATAQTDSAGAALLPAVPDGAEAARLALRLPGGFAFTELADLEPDSSSGDPEWRVDGRRIVGSVVSSGSREALADAVLTCAEGNVVRLGRGSDPLSLRAGGVRVTIAPRGTAAVTDARGRFELTVPASCSRARVFGPPASGDEPGWSERVLDTASWAEGEPVEIELEAGRVVMADVTSQHGVPPSSTEVSLRRPGERTDRVVAGAAGGRSRLVAPDRGPWLVVARAPGFAPAVSGPLFVDPGTIGRATLELTTGGLLVVRATSESLERGRLVVVDGDGIDWSPLTGRRRAPERDDLLELGPLPAGRYVVSDGTSRRETQVRFDGDVREVRLGR